MRLHALSELSSIRLQKSNGMNSDSNCKERTIWNSELSRGQGGTKVINYRTEWKGRAEDKVRWIY